MNEREIPIRFNGDMVRAILDGRKTQTRWLMKPQPPRPEDVHAKAGIDFGLFRGERHDWWRPSGPVWAVRELMGTEPQWRCPYGGPGDLLWVRETHALLPRYDATPVRHFHPERGLATSVFYKAGGPERVFVEGDAKPGRWRPSIHMPRWASRLTLRVTSVRVERLQDISEDDARAEGVVGWDVPSLGVNPRDGFRVLWDSINEKRAPWASNPWVWVVAFERVGGRP